jgi:hypothetical protein
MHALPPPDGYRGEKYEIVLPLSEARALCQTAGQGPTDGCAGVAEVEGRRICFLVIPRGREAQFRREGLAKCSQAK